jgi:UDP-N-acetylmuramate dehydrogenase
MNFEINKSLKEYNTFGIDCTARSFISVQDIDELKLILTTYSDKELFILGGGSNILLTTPPEIPVVHINLKGIEVVSEDDDQVLLKAMAGENWHEFVYYCLEKGYGGLENLSLIPGNVGTAPIQNIGAYGVELKDIFESCIAISIKTKDEVLFDNEACKFGYRDSIFKSEEKGNYIITSVIFRLTKRNHKKNTSYGIIKEKLAERGIESPTISDISEAVIAIRRSKLPDPKVLGNSGSFFKNPVIKAEAFKQFRLQYPDAPFYEVSPKEYKIPAGWLIEKAGFKGKRFGEAGIHKDQALVLVNYGNATGKELWDLALRIQKKVKEQFGIYIEPEVNIF